MRKSLNYLFLSLFVTNFLALDQLFADEDRCSTFYKSPQEIRQQTLNKHLNALHYLIDAQKKGTHQGEFLEPNYQKCYEKICQDYNKGQGLLANEEKAILDKFKDLEKDRALINKAVKLSFEKITLAYLQLHRYFKENMRQNSTIEKELGIDSPTFYKSLAQFMSIDVADGAKPEDVLKQITLTKDGATLLQDDEISQLETFYKAIVPHLSERGVSQTNTFETLTSFPRSKQIFINAMKKISERNPYLQGNFAITDADFKLLDMAYNKKSGKSSGKDYWNMLTNGLNLYRHRDFDDDYKVLKAKVDNTAKQLQGKQYPDWNQLQDTIKDLAKRSQLVALQAQICNALEEDQKLRGKDVHYRVCLTNPLFSFKDIDRLEDFIEAINRKLNDRIYVEAAGVEFKVCKKDGKILLVSKNLPSDSEWRVNWNGKEFKPQNNKIEIFSNSDLSSAFDGIKENDTLNFTSGRGNHPYTYTVQGNCDEVDTVPPRSSNKLILTPTLTQDDKNFTVILKVTAPSIPADKLTGVSVKCTSGEGSTVKDVSVSGEGNNWQTIIPIEGAPESISCQATSSMNNPALKPSDKKVVTLEKVGGESKLDLTLTPEESADKLKIGFTATVTIKNKKDNQKVEDVLKEITCKANPYDKGAGADPRTETIPSSITLKLNEKSELQKASSQLTYSCTAYSKEPDKIKNSDAGIITIPKKEVEETKEAEKPTISFDGSDTTSDQDKYKLVVTITVPDLTKEFTLSCKGGDVSITGKKGEVHYEQTVDKKEKSYDVTCEISQGEGKDEQVKDIPAKDKEEKKEEAVEEDQKEKTKLKALKYTAGAAPTFIQLPTRQPYILPGMP